MATTAYFTSGTAPVSRGENTAKMSGSTSGWVPLAFSESRGSGVVSNDVATVAGPTSGVEIDDATAPLEWISNPVDQDVTIAGAITFNLRAAESNMSANAAINARIERLDSTGAVVSTVVTTDRTTELGTSEAAENFTKTPTSTNMLKGDRLRVTVFADDSSTTMATGFTVTFWYAGTSGGASGDSFVSFSETFGFITSAPAGSTLYLTNTAGPAVGSQTEFEMWTSRGSGVLNYGKTTVNGWTSPLQLADGQVTEWYSKQLQAFTLSDLVACNIRSRENNAGANCTIRAELAVCNGDGSGAVVWGASNYASELGTSEAVAAFSVSGDDVSVTDGQRLRLRLDVDDSPSQAMAASGSLWNGQIYFNGTSGGASGDSYLTLSQSVSEYSATAFAPPFINPARPVRYSL